MDFIYQKRKIIYLFSLWISLSISSFSMAQTKEQIYYRNSIDKSVKDKTTAMEMLNSLEKIENPTLLERGYLGIAYMFKSRHSWNPILKLSYFKKGKNILEETISENPSNVELRFYRATIQKNIPSFLNYHDNLEKDKNFIFSTLDTLKDTDLKLRILKFKEVINSEAKP